MPSEKLRKRIAFEAARLMYDRQESEYFTAKRKAARIVQRGDVKPKDLPSNREIREEIQSLARMFEGQGRLDDLREMRLAALRLMRLLRLFRPRLIGSVLTGHVRRGSDIDLHVFSDSAEAVAATLDQEGMSFEIERKVVRKHGEERVFTHIHLLDRFPIELTVYAENLSGFAFTSSITGKAIERASIAQLETFLRAEYPDLSGETALDDALTDAETQVDRFLIYRMLLAPLENVKESPRYHPESDALYHSLQVFDLAQAEMPHDEEFLLAALLHDVGKAIDYRDHVAAGLEALQGFITPRVAWLIEHHMEAHAIRDGDLGARASRRLKDSEDYEFLLLLSRLDRAGRECGVETSTLDEALDYLRELADACGE